MKALMPNVYQYIDVKVGDLIKIKRELEKMLIREKRMDVYNRCIDFLDTRIELDQSGFKFDKK